MVILPFIALFLLPFASSQRFIASKLETKGPPPRTDAIFHSSGSQAILFGGLGRSGALADTWVYDGLNVTWTRVRTPNAPSPRYASVGGILQIGTSSSDRHLVVSGGRSRRSVLQTSFVWAFSLRDKRWREIKIIPENRSMNVVSILSRANAAGGSSGDNTLIVSHGRNGDTVHSDAYKLSFVNTSTAILSEAYHAISIFSPGDPHAAYNMSSTVTPSNELVLFGGCNAPGSCPNAEAWSYDTTSREWRHVGSSPLPRMRGCMAKSLEGVEKLDLDQRQTVATWGGSVYDLRKGKLHTSERFGGTLSLLDIRSNKWVHEEVRVRDIGYAVVNRLGAGMVPIQRTFGDNYFLVFGGVVDAAEESDHLAEDGLMIEFDPLAGARPFSDPARFRVSNVVSHTWFMLISFGGFFGLGVTVSRYMKVFVRNRRAWYAIHWLTQCFGFLLSAGGLVFAIFKESFEMSSVHAHAVLGYLLMALVSLQVVLSISSLRPLPDESKMRRAWTVFHVVSGWFIVVAGSVNVLLGMLLMVAKPWMWILWCIVVCFVFLMHVMLELLKFWWRGSNSSRYKERLAGSKTVNCLEQCAEEGDPRNSGAKKVEDEQESSWISGLSTQYY